MKNFVQQGCNITVTSPTGGVASGDAVLIGSLFGVAAYTAAEGASLEIATEGVFDLAKVAADSFAVGDKVYWDGTAKKVTSTATSNKWIGIATEVAAVDEVTARVRLNEIAI